VRASATDLTCDLEPYPSVQWTACEASNYAKLSQAPAEQTNPWFQLRLSQQNGTNLETWTARALADPSWLGLLSGNSALTPVGATWQGPFGGDPFRYPEAPGPDGSACEGGWAHPSIIYYAVAWFDRWLKKPGEAGYTDADARLLNDAGPQGAVKMSFHFRSARDFPNHSGVREHCENIRTGC
jgi:hypothetical protein